MAAQGKRRVQPERVQAERVQPERVLQAESRIQQIRTGVVQEKAVHQ